MKNKIVKYSFLIKPLLIIADLLIIFLSVFYFSSKDYLNVLFSIYIILFWILISYYTKFYNVYRYTHTARIFGLTLSQFFIFILSFFSFFSIFREGELIREQYLTVITFTVAISFFKFYLFMY